MDRDVGLRVLSICHYVYAGVSALSALGMLAVVSVAFRYFLRSAKPEQMAQLSEGTGFVTGLLGVWVALALGLATVHVLAGRALVRRRSWMLCIVAGCLSLPSAPLGTALGVFTLVLLLDADTRAEFRDEVPAT